MASSSTQTTSFTSLECVRSFAAKFCEERDWGSFHQPPNLVLALAGEAGELAEVMQWKGPISSSELPLKKSSIFTDKELINIGEEIADVWIYSTRLSDICDIDLASSVRTYLQQTEGSSCGDLAIITDEFAFKKKKGISPAWSELSFDEMDRLISQVVSPKTSAGGIAFPLPQLPSISTSPPSTPLSANDNSYSMLSDRSTSGSQQDMQQAFGIVPTSSLAVLSQSPRSLVMGVQRNVGCICALFSMKSEVDCKPGLPNFTHNEISELALSLASIVVLLNLLSKAFDNRVCKCIFDKFVKNAAKYPAGLVKGSAKKYTEYQVNKPNGVERSSIRTTDATSSASSSSQSLSSRFSISPDITSHIQTASVMVAAGVLLGFLLGKIIRTK